MSAAKGDTLSHWGRRAARSVTGQVLRSTVMRSGTVRPILFGPARGLRYRVYPQYGISPLYGGWEPDLQRALKRYLQPGCTAYDVGANYGVHTILMARLVGPTGSVFAFEPVAALCEAVVDNSALNGFAHVRALEVGVDSDTGLRRFAFSQSAATGHLVSPDVNPMGDVLTIHTVSLDDFVFVQNRPPADVIKIDVEGAEAGVLTGARRLLTEKRPILLIELHTPEQDVAVGTILYDQGYRVFRLETGQPIRQLRRGWPDPDGVWGHVVAIP